MRELEGAVVFVSGSSDGIGKAIAAAFARAGSRVFINGRHAERLAVTAAELGHGVVPVEADLATADGVERVREALPGGRLDILVNNLGIFETRDFFDTSDEDWLHYFEVNVLSAVRLSRAFMRGMLERNFGAVITVASEAGFKPLPHMLHYSVTKTALLGLSRGLAELSKGSAVTANAIAAGPTWTGGVESYIEKFARERGISATEAQRDYFRETEPTSLIQRFLTVEEIADGALFLARNTGVNGSALLVEGGIIRSL